MLRKNFEQYCNICPPTIYPTKEIFVSQFRKVTLLIFDMKHLQLLTDPGKRSPVSFVSERFEKLLRVCFSVVVSRGRGKIFSASTKQLKLLSKSPEQDYCFCLFQLPASSQNG